MGREFGGNSLGGGVGAEWAFQRTGAIAPPLSHPPPLCQTLFRQQIGARLIPNDL